MASTLSVRDETLAGAVEHRLRLHFTTERITLRELIRARVQREVQDHEVALRDGPRPFAGLVHPHKGGAIDWQRQVDVACEAFERRRILVLVGDRQATSLDEVIEVGDQEVTFVRLVPLVGG